MRAIKDCHGQIAEFGSVQIYVNLMCGGAAHTFHSGIQKIRSMYTLTISVNFSRSLVFLFLYNSDVT